jgi:thioredoxin 1
MKYFRITACVTIAFLFLGSCEKSNAESQGKKNASGDKSGQASETSLKTPPVVTFIELGSVDCIPCKAMQPIMAVVRQKYGAQVEVVFHDVWTETGKPYVQKFGIKVIPTQVFLDKNGKEYFRHEGYFPMEDLVKVLEKGGVKL